MTVFATPEQITSVGEEQLVDALDSKYDTLRDKLLSEALMKEMGAAEWQALSEQERQAKLVKMKVEERRLRKEGKPWALCAMISKKKHTILIIKSMNRWPNEPMDYQINQFMIKSVNAFDDLFLLIMIILMTIGVSW